MVISGSPYPRDVRVDAEGIHLTWFRLAAERSYVGTFIPWSDVDSVRAAPFAPDVRLRDGRRVMLPHGARDSVDAAAPGAEVPLVDWPDTWGHLLEPFVDTDYDIVRDRFESELRGWGFSAREIRSIRRRLSVRMTLLTILTWEWGGYHQSDVISTWGMFRVPPLVVSRWWYRRFRRWTDDIANRADIAKASS